MYREFLDAGKTERECSSNICRIAKENGFENLEDVLREGKQLKAGDKIYAENMKKSVIMMEIGTDDIENGMLLIGSHIDSRVWISNRTRCMKTVIWHIWIPIITAESKNISG